VKVYYNEKCSVCRFEIEHYKKQNNKDIDCSKGYRDSNICVMKVALPTNAEITNGDVEFSNEEIIILKHPDLSTNPESTNENNSLSAPASNEYTASRRAAIGDKVCGSNGYQDTKYIFI